MRRIKKALAVLTAAGCMAAAMPVCAIAEESEKPIPVMEYVVTGEKSGSLVVMSPKSTNTYSIAKENITSSNETPEYGDIIEIEGYGFATELAYSTNSMDFWLDEGYQTYGCNVTVTGSLFESGTEEVYTISGIDEMRGFILTNADGKEFRYEDDYLSPETQSGGFCWDDAKVGDTVTMLVYEDIPCIPAAAAPADVEIMGQAMVVVGVDDTENPQNYVMMRVKNAKNLASTYYLPAEAVQAYLTEGTIAYGDILDITGGLVISAGDGTSACTFAEGGTIRIAGSVFDHGTMETYTISDRETSFASAWVMENADGKEFLSYMDFVESGEYVQPGVFLPACKPGEEVVMYTYDGIPTIPVSRGLLGDVNLDGVLDILDVIRINKYILSGEPLPALSGARTGDPGQCDFNGNGTIDADDSLGMMKRILHLE